jgi:hypothetical protein
VIVDIARYFTVRIIGREETFEKFLIFFRKDPLVKLGPRKVLLLKRLGPLKRNQVSCIIKVGKIS